jgi:parallel beta-helix repeat protein
LRSSDYNVLDGNSTGGAESIILAGSNYNTVRNNSAGGSWIGIELTGSNNNTIDNNISKNHWLGIQLSSSSNNNLIFHNNIINNTTQARDDGSNYWDDGYPSGGNYWSDWQPPEHPDANEDGIVDEPRPIAGGGNQDNYPLAQVS